MRGKFSGGLSTSLLASIAAVVARSHKRSLGILVVPCSGIVFSHQCNHSVEIIDISLTATFLYEVGPFLCEVPMRSEYI